MTANAQTTFGSLVGVVTDPSGAVVPGAKVTLSNPATGLTRSMNTSASGTYSFVNLDPGSYTVEVTQQGFKSLTRRDIIVQVGGTARADLVLALGNVDEKVEVTAAPPLIQTDSAALSNVIESRTIQDIPLSGRNVNNLLTLVPGVVAQGSTYGNPSTNLIAFGNYQIGGGFGNQSIFFVDGVQSNIPENNSNVMIPSQDVVSEFRVSTNDVSAEFGGFAGGVVNISTKAGSNQFHATAYEYLRNKVLNANDFFSNRLGRSRPPYVQNQYGFTVGGPVIKNKVFFFFGMEREPVRQATTVQATVPTAAMISGDLSAAGLPPIYDPTTGQQFQYNGKLNVIPPGRIDPAMAKLLQLEYPPAPTIPNSLTNNYIATNKSHYEQKQYNGRVDVLVSPKDTLFARYAYWDTRSVGTNIYKLPATQPNPTGFTDHEAIIGNTYTINPTTIVDARLSYLRAFFFTFPTGIGTDLSGVSPGFAKMVQEQGQKIPINFVFSGTPLAGMGAGAQLYWYNNVYTLSGSITKIVGRHTIKAGGMVRSVKWIASPDSNGGIMNFSATPTANPASPTGTGYSFASALIGLPAQTSTLQVGGSRAFFHNYGFFVTDTFQATKSLTLDLGLRWDQPGAYSEVNNYDTVILPNAPSLVGTINNPATGQSQALKGQLTFVDSPSYPSRREEQLHWKLFDPRIGLAYRITPNMVVRSGYGISYLPSTLSQDGPNSSSVNSSLTNLVNTSYTGTLNTSVSNPFPSGIIQPPRRSAAALTQLYGQNIQSRVPDQKYSYVQQWNLTFERQLGNSSSASIAYAGARGTHLQMAGAATWSALNLNQLPDNYASLGPDLLTKVNNPLYGTVTTPGLLSGTTAYKGLFLKPMPQYNYVTASAARNGFSNYNALQAAFKKRFGNGGILTASYTWAKLLTNTDSITAFLDVGNFGNFYVGGVQDNTNLKGEKSLSLNDYPQVLTIGYGLDLPFGRHQRYLATIPSAANAVIGGWRVNGITSFVAGTPLAIGANANDAAQPNYLMLYFGGGGYLQNQNGQEPLRPNLVPGCNRKVSGSAVDKVNSGKWFNTACFTQPGSFQYGNERRTDSVLRRQGVDNWDFSVAKTTPLVEKITLTFTAEFFNIANRVQFAPPFEAMYSGPNWGHVTAQANNPRQVQFGLRLTY